MANATAPKATANGNGKAPAVTAPATPEEFQPKKAAGRLWKGLGTLLDIKLKTAHELTVQSVYYAIKDMLSSDLTLTYSKQHNNKPFPWADFSAGFEKIMGKVEEPHYSPEEMVEIARYLIPGIPEDNDAAIQYLVDQNRRNLSERKIINTLKPKSGKSNPANVDKAFDSGNDDEDFFGKSDKPAKSDDGEWE